ncbi:hypothetical protein [Nocardia macrotermitis]|uniref:Uncharacterized protein n=1 Tax=Nocardia macrotermitis TaxID=2585198 RepID=A0A7K0D2J8_9NOCA|nr:hypothetical protein [Nocardia macrotermitis]MQY19482.1 hypothetical protein [Nocardia macrotermitis]
MQLNRTTSVRRSIWLAFSVVILAAIVSMLLWFWLHRESQSSKYLDNVIVSGFDKIAQNELGNNGSGDYPPSASAYFLGPSGRVNITAPGFTVTRVDPPDDFPGMKLTVLYRGVAPQDCVLLVNHLYPTAQIPNWANLSGKQRSAFESGSSQVLEIGVFCGG